MLQGSQVSQLYSTYITCQSHWQDFVRVRRPDDDQQFHPRYLWNSLGTRRSSCPTTDGWMGMTDSRHGMLGNQTSRTRKAVPWPYAPDRGQSPYLTKSSARNGDMLKFSIPFFLLLSRPASQPARASPTNPARVGVRFVDRGTAS